jgi:polyhydroxybutyrate depolymerase
VALHGFSENARLMELNTGFSKKADQEGFFVVYPYGVHETSFSPYSWNSKFCCGYALQQGVDDAGFILRIIDEITSEYNIDTSKIYITGFSNGAMMAQQVALKAPSKIAALAVVSGAVGGKNEDDEQFGWLDQSGVPVPVVIFHGKQDAVIPFGGGEGSGQVFEFKGAYDVVNLWLQNDRCSKYPTEISKGDNYTRELYAECDSQAEVVFYTVDDKHVWPGGMQEFIKNFSNRNIKATDIIWDFFAAH